MQFKRVFVVITAPFLLTVLVAAYLPLKAVLILIGIAFIVLLLCRRIVKRQYLLTIILAVVFVLIGVSGFFIKSTLEVQTINALKDKESVIEATITDIIREGNDSNAYQVKVTAHPFQDVPKQFKMNLYSPTALNVTNYDKIILPVKFFEISSTSTFDTKQYYQSNNIYIFAYASKPVLNKTTPAIKPIPYYLSVLNEQMCEIISVNLSKQNAGIIKAMLLGDSSGIDDKINYSFVNSGIVHITAVSGLHVSVIAGGLLLLLKLVKAKRRTTAIITIIAVWGFVGLTGFHISAIRSGIMFTVMQAAAFTSRQSDTLNSLFISGLIIVLSNPFAILDVGFQLTFTCTLGIVSLSKPLAVKIINTFKIKNSIIKTMATSIAITLSITFTSLPILISMSKGISIAAPIINMVALPITPVVLVSSIALLICSAIPILSILTPVISVIINFQLAIITSMSQFVSNRSSFFLGLDYPSVNVIVIMTMVCLLFSLLFYKKAFFTIACCGTLCLLAFPLAYRVLTYNHLNVTTFSSYTGSAVVSITQGKADVFVLSSDGYICTEISRFLDGKNINIINRFAVLEPITQSCTDIDMLTGTKSVTAMFVDEKNDIIDLYDASALESDSLTKLNKERVVLKNDTALIRHNDIVITITSNDDVAQNANCEFLFFYKKSSQQLKHFEPKYAIILNECDIDMDTNIVSAEARQLSLQVDSKNNSKYQYL